MSYVDPKTQTAQIRFLQAVPKLSYIPGRDLNLEERAVLREMIRQKKLEMEEESKRQYPDVTKESEFLKVNEIYKYKLINMRNQAMKRISMQRKKKVGLQQFIYEARNFIKS